MLFALRYLYTAETSCSFLHDQLMLRELLVFCQSEELPAALRAWAAEGLLRSEGRHVADLLLEAKSLQLPAQAQRFLAVRFLCEEEARASGLRNDEDLF